MKTFTLLIQVNISEDIENLYPNYSINYNDEEEFLDTIINEIETPIELDGVPYNSLKTNGYEIKVLTRDESKLLDV